MEYIDLHVHSNRSDGTLSPAELVRLASDSGLRAFALTDHDSIDGLAEATAAAQGIGVEVVSGIEFSTEYEKTDIHILGLDFDWHHPAFQERLTFYRDERKRRNLKMIDRMAADGISISLEQMRQEFGDGIWTRAHFARHLLSQGYVRDLPEAFRRYVGEGCRYFIPRHKVSPFEAVALLREYNGIPILAHPFQYRFEEADLRLLLKRLKEAGLIGMETFYSLYTEDQSNDLLTLASEYDLAPSGGSDFHGANKPGIALGSGRHNLRIPYSVLDDLRIKKEEHHGTKNSVHGS